MKKRILLLIIIALIFINITGCKTTKEEVNLKTEKEIVQYASKRYGKAKYISHQSGDDLIRFILQDNQYKFNYECTSSITQTCIDGSCAELYYETTKCDFAYGYQKYIIDELNIDKVYQNYHKNYPKEDGSKKILFAVRYENGDEASQNLKNIVKQIKKIDTRKYFLNYHIDIYDNNNVYIGFYDTNDDKYINQYESAIDRMTHAFALEVNNSTSNLDGIKYLYYKRIQYKDVEKLEMKWLYKKNVTSEDWTTAYYFEYHGKTYFILDDRVFIEQNVFNQSIYDKYYTSYWFTN